MNNGEIQNPRNRNAHRTTSPKLQRLYSKQPLVDCEVEVNDLGVVRSILCWVRLELEEICVEGEVEEVVGAERVWVVKKFVSKVPGTGSPIPASKLLANKSDQGDDQFGFGFLMALALDPVLQILDLLFAIGSVAKP
jgi:hypothetical protein